jgi:ABC-type transport auxiliary lipoprotein component
MTRVHRSTIALAVVLAGVGAGGSACQLRRPDVIAARMIEPQLIEPTQPPTSTTSQGNGAVAAVPVRLLETQARSHIGRRLLHQVPDGELVEDAVWRWSSAPSRYLDSALRIAFASSPGVQLVDSGSAEAMSVTLITWHLETADSVQLVGAVELVVTTADRVVQAHVIRGSEPVSSELPGNLAAAAGRLLQTLASASVAQAAQQSGR